MTPITNVKIVRLGRKHGGLTATAHHGQYLHANNHPSQVIVDQPVAAPGKELLVNLTYAISGTGMPTTNHMILDHINEGLYVFMEVIPG